MLPNDILLTLARSAESQYLERKATYPGTSEVKKTLCAFANSTPENQYSVLFLGIHDDGTFIGVPDAELDGMQKNVINVGRTDCYPPIPVVPQVFEVEGKKLLAVIVEHSKAKPHFTGHAYRRRGSQSEKASDAEHNEFVLERIDKVRRIRKELGNTISVRWGEPPEGLVPDGGPLPANNRGYLLWDCDAFFLTIEDVSVSNHKFAIPLESVTVSYNYNANCFRLLVAMPYPILVSSLLKQALSMPSLSSRAKGK